MKGSLIGLGFAAILGASVALAAGCSSSSSGGGGSTPSGTYCDVTTNGVEICTGVSGSGDTSSFTSQCTQSGGKVVSSCPSANQIGCCTIAGSNGASASSCTYCPSVETQDGLKMACTQGMGTFTAGSETMCSSGTGDGGGGGNDGSTTSPDTGTSSGGGDASGD
jgi:hypothetical protein